MVDLYALQGHNTTITVEDILIKTSGIINVHVSIHNMLLIIAVKRVRRHDDRQLKLQIHAGFF